MHPDGVSIGKVVVHKASKPKCNDQKHGAPGKRGRLITNPGARPSEILLVVANQGRLQGRNARVKRDGGATAQRGDFFRLEESSRLGSPVI